MIRIGYLSYSLMRKEQPIKRANKNQMALLFYTAADCCDSVFELIRRHWYLQLFI